MGLVPHSSKFSKKRKDSWLRIAKKLWPNVSEICRQIGISTSTYYLHVQKDLAFNRAVKDLDQEVTDRIEGVLATMAVQPRSFLDRISYLRAHRPELYNPAKVVRVEGVRLTDQDAHTRLAMATGAIDAELVEQRRGRVWKVPEVRGGVKDGSGQEQGGGGGGVEPQKPKSGILLKPRALPDVAVISKGPLDNAGSICKGPMPGVLGKKKREELLKGLE